MGLLKAAIISEQLEQEDAERRAAYAAGHRKQAAEPTDAFDYLYNTNQLHLLDQYPEMTWNQVADMALRDASARPSEAGEVFGADQ